MAGKFVMLIGPTPPASGAGLVNQVLQQWNPPQRPPTESLSIEHVLNDPSHLEQCAVAWLIVDRPQHESLYELTALLQDHHVTGLLTRPGDSEPLGTTFLEGVLTCPPNADPSAIAAVVRALWSQADVIKALKVESSILRLRSDGVVDMFGKIDEELRLAAQLQRDLLPKSLPQAAKVSCDVLFRPAGYVSGDIYDVAQLDDKHIGFFLADAVGHGVPAALMTVFIQSAMAVIETEGNNGGRRIIAPNEALARLNHAIVTYESNHVRTATAVCGIINTETHELLIARAGHPYPILLNGEGTATDITAEGAMLGVFDDARYDLQRVQLEPGDRLIIYSDGFEMAFPQIDPADATRLATVTDQYLTEFLDLGQGSVDAALGRLGDKLDQQAGSLNQMDDLTVVLVGIEPAGEPIECPTPLTQTA